MIVLLCCYTGAKLNCYCLFYAMTRESAPQKARTGHRYFTLYTKPLRNFNRYSHVFSEIHSKSLSIKEFVMISVFISVIRLR